MNEKNIDSSANSSKKPNKTITILKYIAKSVLAIFLILSIVYQLPWKIITLLAIIFAGSTILPCKYRKRFQVAVLALALTLVIWLFFPEDNSNWRPYTFENAITELESKYKIPDEENAAFEYYKIFENLTPDVNQPGYFTSSPELSSLSEFWLAEDYPELAKWIADNQEIIESIISASKLPKCIMPPDFYKNRFRFPLDSDKLQRCVFTLISIANNDIAEGRIDEAMEKYITCFRIANQIHQYPSFTHVIFSWVIKEGTFLPIKKAIIEGKIDSAYFQQILNLIDDMYIDWSTDWVKMLDIDMVIMKNQFAGSTFETDGMGKLRYSRRPFNIKFLQKYTEYTFQSEITGKIRAVLRWLCFPSSTKSITQIIEDSAADHYDMAKPDYDWNKKENIEKHLALNYKFVIKNMIQDNTDYYHRIHTIYLKSTTLLQGSKILVAIRQYKDEHGTWPENLDEIKSDAPAEAFIDPATGLQLQYKKSGEDFTLSGELVKIWPFDN